MRVCVAVGTGIRLRGEGVAVGPVGVGGIAVGTLQFGMFSTSPGCKASGLPANFGLAAIKSSALTLNFLTMLYIHSPRCTVWIQGPSVGRAVGVARRLCVGGLVGSAVWMDCAG